MKYTIILVRYGEISLKSTYVRRLFESILIRNIDHALTQENIRCSIQKERGRIYLCTDDIVKTCNVLKHIVGIVSFSPAIVTKASLEDISTLALSMVSKTLTKTTSFAIRATRSGTHSFTSQDVAIRVGKDIVQATGSPVDLTKPSFELFIEIRGKQAFLFIEKIKGSGGLPLGTQGKVLAIIDSPFSLVAAWFLMKRGCSLSLILTKNSLSKPLNSFLQAWYVPSEITRADVKIKNFYKILENLTVNDACDAIVTGYSLKENTDAITKVYQLKKHTGLPIFCPLLAMDISEIQHQAKEIGIPL